VTYGETIREYARQRGLRRRLLHSSLLTPRLSRFFLGLVSPINGQVAGALVESLRNETVVRSAASLEAFPVRPRGLEGAVERALINEDLAFAETRWSDALAPAPQAGLAPTPVGRRLVSSRVLHVNADATDAFDPIQRIGGHTGWYAGSWFWRARGLLDTLSGGAGLRRGRRDTVNLRVGDTIDFWRVDALEPVRRLRLAADMRIPGRLWLQFEVDPDDDGGVQVRQTTVFDPAGWVGLAYWYLLSPIHHLVFGNMLRGIGRVVGRRASTHAASPVGATGTQGTTVSRASERGSWFRESRTSSSRLLSGIARWPSDPSSRERVFWCTAAGYPVSARAERALGP
jgi:hypothetical protein